MFYNVEKSMEAVTVENRWMEVEALAYSKPGEPPRPVTFRFMIDEAYMKGTVKKVRDRKINRFNGNLMYEYLCDAEIEERITTVKLSYERDTMKWYLHNL